MSLNPNITVAVYFRISDGFFHTVGTAPASALAKWGPLYHATDEVDEDGNPVQGELMTQPNTSMRQAVEAARAAGNRDVEPPFPVRHFDSNPNPPQPYIDEVTGEEITPEDSFTAWAPERNPETPTHWMIGMRNVGGQMDAEAMQIATAQSLPFSHVKLAHDETLQYLNHGILPA